MSNKAHERISLSIYPQVIEEVLDNGYKTTIILLKNFMDIETSATNFPVKYDLVDEDGNPIDDIEQDNENDIDALVRRTNRENDRLKRAALYKPLEEEFYDDDDGLYNAEDDSVYEANDSESLADKINSLPDFIDIDIRQIINVKAIKTIKFNRDDINKRWDVVISMFGNDTDDILLDYYKEEAALNVYLKLKVWYMFNYGE